MAKRGESGISRVIAVDKPVGLSSHDVVDECRRIFGERRVGHTGTLDPLASGILNICIGPATRLGTFLVDHDKTYRMEVEFGTATTTDDAEGEVIKALSVPEELLDPDVAQACVAGLVGRSTQIPPVYSAIKVAGRKAYEQARCGKVIELAPREFEVFEARLNEVKCIVENGEPLIIWDVTLHVSKGTYMRSIARDLGHGLRTVAHVRSLRRVTLGDLSLEDCLSLEELKENPQRATVDPLRLLGVRYAFVREEAKLVENGSPLRVESVRLNEPLEGDCFSGACCMTSVMPSSDPPRGDEQVAIVVHNRLKALYVYDEISGLYKPRCVFAVGVERDSNL